MSLYNELRPPFTGEIEGLMDNYTWAVWYDHVKQGTQVIHDANQDVLIFLSGMLGGTDLQAVVEGAPLEPSTATFDLADFPANKIVLELHNYGILSPVVDCPSFEQELLDAGFSAGPGGDAALRLPVVMSEWGFANDDVTWRNGTYATCMQRFLRDAMPADAGWMVWVIAGSYYVREGVQDYDESWGLLDHDWSDWRSPEYIEGGLKPLVSASSP